MDLWRRCAKQHGSEALAEDTMFPDVDTPTVEPVPVSLASATLPGVGFSSVDGGLMRGRNRTPQMGCLLNLRGSICERSVS